MNTEAKRFLIQKDIDPDEISIKVDYSKIPEKNYLLADLLQEYADSEVMKHKANMLEIYNTGIREGIRRTHAELKKNN